MTIETDVATLVTARTDGVTVVDVREPEEYAAGHVPGATNMPLARLGGRVGELPTTGTVYVICASGNRSKVATQALRRAGLDALSVAGGTKRWQQAGNPVTTGPRP